jgi:tetratricopeptide (TPR) repeat protein
MIKNPKKNKLIQQNIGRFSASRFSKIFILACLISASAALAEGSAPESLSRLEKAIVGSESLKLPLEARLKNLEIKVFARVQSGSLKARISALEGFAGIKEAGSMPPLPPAIDRGRAGASPPGPSKETPEKAGKESREPATAGKNKPLAHELEEAVKLHHEGRDFEAEQSLMTILNRNPKNADACFSLGAIAETKGDLQAALEYYTLAMQANPDDSEARDAVADLSAKLKAVSDVHFFNPLATPPQPSATLLQGRALAVGANAQAANNNISARARLSNPQIPTLAIRQQPPPRSSFARTLARGALEAALSGTGLHCPLCALLRGF